ncbi:MAG: hypothetical protein HYU64_02065 [Armatimonadetes bacterium]|nr:hypothetical protein [Armatimonadota bacterium]
MPDIRKKMREGGPLRGWGMYLIKNLMDHVELEVDPEELNTQLTMVIHLGK